MKSKSFIILFCVSALSVNALNAKTDSLGCQPVFYVDMGKGALDGQWTTMADSSKTAVLEDVVCSLRESHGEDGYVWNISLKNQGNVPFQPEKAGIRLGIDTYMDKYPEWLTKYFPTFMNCSRTHFYGYMQSPSGKMLAIVSSDPVASWSVDYNLSYPEPEGYWFYGHRICSVNLDLLNALPLPAHNPQNLWQLLPGQSIDWKVIFISFDDAGQFEEKVHAAAGIPVMKMAKTSYSAGETAMFEVIGESPEVLVTDPAGRSLEVELKKCGSSAFMASCRLGNAGLYDVEVRSGNFITEGKLSVHRSWEWVMRRAREGALKHKQRATSHVESWYGYHTAFIAAKHFPDETIDTALRSRFDFQMRQLNGEDISHPLYYDGRIQNTAGTIGMFVDKFEAYGCEEDLEHAERLADWMIGYAQKSDDAYRNGWGIIYTSVIYVAKSVLELYLAEVEHAESLRNAGKDDSRWKASARRHYESAKRAIDQLVASQGDFHTEGEMTFEDGMVSCSALQMGLLGLLQKDPQMRRHYADAMLVQLESHDCLTQLRVPDARRRGGTMRFWEAQYDVLMLPNMFNTPHGWSAWRAYATYYAYLLTGDEKWLLQTWNAMGAFANLIDYRTGELRWAFVLDPYIKARQMCRPVPGVSADSLDFGNPHPELYEYKDFIFGEDYVPMVSSWQTKNSQDNDVHEVFKCLGETFLTNAFVVEREDGTFAGYNCDVVRKGRGLVINSHEKQITNLHVNIRSDRKITFNGQKYFIDAGFCDFLQ